MGRRSRPPEWVRDDRKRRAILVGIDFGDPQWPIDESLAELESLAITYGCEVVASISQRIDKARARTLIGSGKIEEAVALAAQEDVDLLIFDAELSPRHESVLADALGGLRIIDRTGLILEIFGQHAVSSEGKLQVELAQLEYTLPRLRGMWGHLVRERLGGGRGAIFGAGESQLETDRRLVRKRIINLKSQLRHLADSRATQRKARRASGIFRVALVGYTNAGKSTLMNALTGSEVLSYDMLFATLDSTTRKLILPDGRTVTLTDTVGFINKLPHGLVEAFKSSLDEVREADLLLHVIDAAHIQAGAQAKAVDKVLDEIGAHEIPRALVFNKTDKADGETLERLMRQHPHEAFVSGITGSGLEDVVSMIMKQASSASQTMTVVVPYDRGSIIQLAHEQTHVIDERHLEHGTKMSLGVPHRLIRLFEEFVVQSDFPEHSRD